MSDAKIADAPSFPELVRQFFVDYLLNQRAISPNTIASYRDAMLLFLDFAHEHLGKAPSALRLVDISPDLLLAFLHGAAEQRVGVAAALAELEPRLALGDPHQPLGDQLEALASELREVERGDLDLQAADVHCDRFRSGAGRVCAQALESEIRSYIVRIGLHDSYAVDIKGNATCHGNPGRVKAAPLGTASTEINHE